MSDPNALLTAAQMRRIEQAAIESGSVTGLELMERAGRGTVDAILAEWPEMTRTPHRAVVLCGPGNNGGDGFVVARLLKERGWQVEVFLYGDPEKLPPDARTNYERWIGSGEQAAPISLCFSDRFVNHPIVIDALFGTGLSRPVPEEVRSILMATLNCRRIALDVPSVLSSDTGKTLSHWPTGISAAHLTVTFHSRKVGHVLSDGPSRCGKLAIVDIGLEAMKRAPTTSISFSQSQHTETEDRPRPEDGGENRPRPGGRVGGDPGLTPWEDTVHLTHVDASMLRRPPHAHKYTHGHALILSGGCGKGGAARLAARGALRIGAGLVTVACPPAALQENAARLDAIMLRPVRDSEALAELLSDKRLNALCLGPGLGLDRARELVPVALKTGRPCVLDGDALTAFADDPAALWALTHDQTVLTPHGGEFARLFPDIAERLAAPAETGPASSKVDATREAAARAGCVVLYKGPDTVIADAHGRAAINAAAYDREAPWLATAGSGDVLAGFITGLLAQGLWPLEAAGTAAWLHVECARRFGPGLIAEDLPEQLPSVFRDLGL